jgi:hypothetical protein
MSDDIPASMAEAMAEIRRLRARILELEAAAAITFGTPQQRANTYTFSPNDLARYQHNVPPSAPPHNERPPIGNDDE